MPSTRYLVPQPTPVEQLPPYSRRRDSDTSSIRSSAPSYVSEAPTYHSQVPPTHERLLGSGPSLSPSQASSRRAHSQPEITGLPPISYAPGFHRAPSHSRNDLKHLTFNISEWSSAKNGPQARHYQAVANRRAKLASIEEKARLTNIASTMVFPSLASITSTESPESLEEAGRNETNINSTGIITSSTPSSTAITSASASIDNSASTTPAPQSSTTLLLAPAVSESTSTTTTTATTSPEPTEPLSPLEDPELVGHAAAKAARERRLYMTRCLTESAALKQENASWDFMLGQMADWSERERSWDGFRRDVEGRKLLGNRLLRRIMPY